MHMFNRILVTTDLSEASEIALPWAAMFAQAMTAELTLFFALDPGPVDYYEFFNPAEGETLEKAQQYVTKRLENMAERLLPLNKPTIKVVMSSVPHKAILRTALEEKHDLIVMATHGRTGIEHLLLGSITERVVKHSHVPVLCIREHPSSTPGQARLRRILCPSDLSDKSRRAIELAADIAMCFNAELYIVHIAPAPGTPGEPGAGPQDTARLEEELKNFIPESTVQCPAVNYRVLHGEVTMRITGFADEQEADLIVMSTHGHGGLIEYLIGTHAERVLRHSNHPVLMLPARSEDVPTPNAFA